MIAGRQERHGEGKRGGRPIELRLQLLWLWVLIVVLYFAWEAATYHGLFAMLSEWQFERLGQELPTINFGLLAMLFAWPALLIFRRWRASEAEADVPPGHAEEEALRVEGVLATSAANDYMHFLLGFATALLLAALVALVWTLFLPTERGTVQNFAPTAATFDRLHDGPARLEGGLRYGRIASFGRGIFFFRRTTLYAPIVPPAGDSRDVRYFVEFMPAERADVSGEGGTLSHRAGILVRSDLPGALTRLYRYLGYIPARHYYVLYASSTTLRAPYFILAAQFALGALGFLAAALWQRFHLARLPREIRRRRAAIIRRRREAEVAAMSGGTAA